MLEPRTDLTLNPDVMTHPIPTAASVRSGGAETHVPSAQTLAPLDRFPHRHIGPSVAEIQQMVEALGCQSLDELMDRTIPSQIRSPRPLQLGRIPSRPVDEDRSESQVLAELKAIASQNQVFRSWIGMGYHGCLTPPVIQRNILENPGWYTQYTPYQAEIAQGRLEALFNFQTMVTDLTGLSIANASLLDEGTAAAEAMAMAYGIQSKRQAHRFLVAADCHPQTLEVLRTRAQPIGIEIQVGDPQTFDLNDQAFALLLQYPTTDGRIQDYTDLIDRAHQAGLLVIVAADLLSLTLLKPPGEMGADIAVGSTQRFGVPMGYGGPHAAYFATREEYKRQSPGRLVGLSHDVNGKPALRLALQTREQHIRRDKATSNICTAQVLLAVIASMYAVYHGPEGLKQIAQRIHHLTSVLAQGLQKLGYRLRSTTYFDTLRVEINPESKPQILQRAKARRINLRVYEDASLGISLDETTSAQDLIDLLLVFTAGQPASFSLDDLVAEGLPQIPASLQRTSPYLTHPVFSSYHSETELLRYLYRLQSRDLSLTTSMIPLGSCTMKLNATVEMIPITWPEFSSLHPFAPREQTQGYQILFKQLQDMLAEITGFAGVSLQPNAGSQGEYAGLLVIREYHQQRGEAHRNICLIPTSAHGTNPASAVMAGMKVVTIQCDEAGNIDVADLKAKAASYQDQLAALMITYPSTHGVFEEAIKEICGIVHEHGGQVYMDGANLNAQVGLCRPGELGADVCHLNLHKTFCIPHGGGGPGMGPIGVAAHLQPYLPDHGVISTGGQQGIGAIAAAPWGSSSILPISWAYIALMGSQGLTEATRVAILNANYMAKRLEPYYPVLYKGAQGFVAHECILDLRGFKKSAGIEVDDIAKRLMDFGYHAPTVSWPVAGTIMVEPTESESKAELDRFCEAMIAIRGEIRDIETGESDPQNNALKHAPHTAEVVISDSWDRPYPREQGAYPAEWTRMQKFWPVVSRIDNAFGDRNLVCSCPPIESYEMA